MFNLPTDLVEHLRRQLTFINASCHSYDQGFPEEALRIAVALRVLFHDTKKSTSLLTHLSQKQSVRLISTIGLGKTNEQLGDSMVFYTAPMLILGSVPSKFGSRPPQLGRYPSKLVTCNAWWNEIVMSKAHRLSRRDVVLSSANQDGGAHVDTAPNQKTLQLKEGIGTYTLAVNGVDHTEKLTDHHFPMLRQFGYEVLNSLEITGLL